MFIRKHPGILCTGTFFVELSVPFTVVFHLGIFEQGIDIYMKDDPAGHVSKLQHFTLLQACILQKDLKHLEDLVY